jgi:hypothetical protein
VTGFQVWVTRKRRPRAGDQRQDDAAQDQQHDYREQQRQPAEQRVPERHAPRRRHPSIDRRFCRQNGSSDSMGRGGAGRSADVGAAGFI